jgi:hypothetical protein
MSRASAKRTAAAGLFETETRKEVGPVLRTGRRLLGEREN